MSGIFISYRSMDYEEGVSALYSHLIDLFGEEEVVLDKSSFTPGSSWLPQIRSKVAMSDIVICVIGSSWTTERNSPHHDEIDYVVEELTLAHKLGKKVIPITLGVNPNQIRNSLPPDITWLADIQFFLFDPKAAGNDEAIGNLIVDLGGPKIRKGADVARQKLFTRGNFSMLRVFYRTLGSIFRPTAHAASAMQSTLTSLQSSSLLAVASLALLSLVSILISGELSLFVVTRHTASLTVTALLAFVVLITMAKFAASRQSVLSIASFSIHFSAAVHTALSAWFLLLWIVLSDSVQQRFTSMTVNEIPILQQIEALYADLTSETMWALVVIQFGLIIHLVIIVFGVWRAGVIVLGWKRWTQLPLYSVLAIALVVFIHFLLSSSDGIRRENLPQQVKLTWMRDQVYSDGIKRTPFFFEVKGTMEKRENSIEFHVNQFRAENRAQPAIEIRAVMCALRIIRGGQGIWPDVMHEVY